jgi:2'-5' RNA ligase
MSAALRLFFALPAPEAVRELAARVQAQLPRAALPALDGLHLTLAFLGDQEPGRVEALLETARRAAAGHAPFLLETAGLGAFGKASAPRLLFLAFRSQPALAALATDLRQGLRALGASFDPKPLRPHLTLARLKEPVTLASLVPGPDLAFEAREVILYRSTLSPAGSRYESLGSAAFSTG